MKQTRGMSLIEAMTNVAIGYGIAVSTQMLVFPVFGLQATVAQNLKMGLVFTVVSIVRSFAIRRLFETIRTRRGERDAAARAGRLRQNPIVFRREFCKPGLDSRSSRR